jgi:hypothetical protein
MRRIVFTTLTWLCYALSSVPAHGLPITVGAGGPNPFLVDPLYFTAPSAQDPNPIGLVGPGDGVDLVVGDSAFAISACGVGGGCALSIATSLITPVYQNPQRPADSLNPQTPQGTPSPALPFVADSSWTVQNTSGVAITDAWLLFTGVDFTGGYPVVGMALDQLAYVIAQIGVGNSAGYYGALHLGALAAGQTAPLKVRYIVTGDLKDVGGSLQMPPLGISGLVVPEPGTAGLVGLGILAMARPRRRTSR